MIATKKTLPLNMAGVPAAVRNKFGMATAARIPKGIKKTKPSMKRAPNRMPTLAYCSDEAAPGPLAITRLKNAGLQLPHTQFPAICTKSECANIRPHCEHAKAGCGGACCVIGHLSLVKEVALSVAQTAHRTKHQVRPGCAHYHRNRPHHEGLAH